MRDTGSGLPEGQVGRGLGTQIVRTLIQGELGGTIDWHTIMGSGTEVTIDIPLRYIDAREERADAAARAPLVRRSAAAAPRRPGRRGDRVSSSRQEARRARAARRLRARRSSSERPPQTPES